ncbi:unnamed protein product [Polarella glacialis]|uniref:Uncharacterized protein n=1 Tax=Polarella glacialis TaxID=89957 RepID=A0A813KUW2_POLGL|nr:unnamed protein product [Polarella glacialis]
MTSQLIQNYTEFGTREWQGTRYIYAAHAESAERQKALGLAIGRDDYLTGIDGAVHVDRWVAVVGSFAHLTQLLAMEPREIYFVDLNRLQLNYFSAILALIQGSDSRSKFLGALFARPLDFLQNKASLALHIQDPFQADENLLAAYAFHTAPPNEDVFVKSFLQIAVDAGREAACTYSLVFHEFLANSVDVPSERPPCICDKVELRGGCNVQDPMNPRPNPEHMYSVCNFQVGQGWLATDGTYRTVRERLRRAHIKLFHKDFLQGLSNLVEAHHRTVVYASNVFTIGDGGMDYGNDWVPEMLRELHWKVLWGGGHVHMSCYESDKYCKEVYNGNNDDARMHKKHVSALAAVSIAVAEFSEFWDVTSQTPYGFSEFDTGQMEAIVGDEYRTHDVPIKHRHNTGYVEFVTFARERPQELMKATCLIHALLGSDVAFGTFLEVLAASLYACARTVLLEHNKESLDFILPADVDPAEQMWRNENWRSATELIHLLKGACHSKRLLSIDRAVPLSMTFVQCAAGLKDGCRNVAVVVDRTFWDLVPPPGRAEYFELNDYLQALSN